MTKIERLLVPGSTELPDCRCGQEMSQVSSERRTADSELRVYRCCDCGHEMRLTVWLDLPPDLVSPG